MRHLQSNKLIHSEDNTFSAFEAEREKLADFIVRCPGQYAIEIGAFKGTTTVHLARACEEVDKQLIAIDPWDNRQDESGEDTFAEFTRSIKPYRDRVMVIRDDSQHAELPEAVHGDVCLVFVDGNHSYPHCKQDMETYFPLLAAGGCLAVHDTFDSLWGEDVRRGFVEFVDTLRPPIEIFHYQYEPTDEEAMEHQHWTSGISYLFRK